MSVTRKPKSVRSKSRKFGVKSKKGMKRNSKVMKTRKMMTKTRRMMRGGVKNNENTSEAYRVLVGTTGSLGESLTPAQKTNAMLTHFRATQAASKAANVITSFRSQQTLQPQPAPTTVSPFIRGIGARKAFRKEDGRHAGMEARPEDLKRLKAPSLPTTAPALPTTAPALIKRAVPAPGRPTAPKPAQSSPKLARLPKNL